MSLFETVGSIGDSISNFESSVNTFEHNLESDIVGSLFGGGRKSQQDVEDDLVSSITGTIMGVDTGPTEREMEQSVEKKILGGKTQNQFESDLENQALSFLSGGTVSPKEIGDAKNMPAKAIAGAMGGNSGNTSNAANAAGSMVSMAELQDVDLSEMADEVMQEYIEDQIIDMALSFFGFG